MKQTFKNKKFVDPTDTSPFISRRSLAGQLNPLDKKGFTLVELLIVVALVAILTFIAIPQITILANKSRLNGAARLVWGDLQNAKMTAIKTNGTTTVTFNNSTNYSFPRGGGQIFTRDLTTEYPNVTVVTAGGSTVAFASTGIILPAASMTLPATITIQNSQGSKTISVLWTGRILIN